MAGPLDDFLARREQEQGRTVRVVLPEAVKANPDQAAEARRMAQRYQVPPSVSQERLDQFRQKWASDDAAAILRDAPRASAWLSNLDNAKIAHDDTPSLAGIEMSVRRAPAKPEKSWADTASGWFDGLSWRNAGKALTAGLVGVAGGAAGLVRQQAERPDNALQQVNPAIGALTSIANTLTGGKLQQVTQTIAERGSTAARLAGDAWRPKVQGVAAQGVLAGVESLPITASSILLGIAGTPAAGLAFAGAATGGLSYEKARSEGLSPGRATIFGGVDAAIEVATERVPFLKFLEDTQVGRPAAQRFMRNLVSENIGEQFATVGQDFNQFVSIDANKGKTIGDFLRERPDAALQTLIATTTSVGAINTGVYAAERAAGRVQQRIDAADRAEPTARAVAELSDLAAASKLRGREVTTFEQFVAQAAEDGPLTDVFVDPTTLTEILNQSGVDAESLIASVPALAEQIEEATATGRDVRIPVEQFAARLGGTDVGNALIEHLKSDPDGLSIAEARTLYQNAPEELRAAVEREMQVATANDEWAASADRVRDNILGELTTANRFTADVNNAYASMVGNFFRVMAAREGVMPEELAQRYGLRVRAEDTVQGGQRLGQGPMIDIHRSLYHGSPIAWEEFDPDEAVSDGWWFSTSRDVAESFGLDRAGEPPHNPNNRRVSIVEAQLSDANVKIVDVLADAQRVAEEIGVDAPQTWAEAADLLQWSSAQQQYIDDARDEGFDVVWFKDVGDDPANAGGGTSLSDHIVVLDPTKARIIANTLNQNDGEPRGFLQFTSDITRAPSIITLLRGADLSTFLHESGHFFLEVMSDMAARDGAPTQIADDMGAVLKWFGVADNATWRAMPLEEKREHHEAFARGFEAYLFEGRAPSVELKGLFQRFRAWLVSVYRTIDRLNVTLTDEVRGVFDRMLASETEIAEAEQAAGFEPILTEKPAGMTDAEYREYQGLGLDATREAISELERRSLRDMRYAGRAKARELKRLQADVAARRTAMEDEVRADISARPVYRAIEFLRRGMLDGAPVDGPSKFNIEAFDALYEGFNETERDLVKRRLGYGKYGMLSKDGINPQQVSDLFGFTSPDHLITALLDAVPIADMVEAETDQRMLERYGDISSPQALDEAASEAVHNDVRARFVATEMAALSKAPGKPRVLARAAKQFATDMIARLKVKDIRPAVYEAAERRASKRAADALVAGDEALAATEKRNQLVNLSATRVAREAQDEVRKAIDYLRKFDNEGTRKNLDIDYLEQIDAITDRFELRPSVSNRAMQRRASLLEWVERQREAGYEPTIDAAVLDEARRVHYRDLTLEELRGVIDAVRNIEHLGRLKKRLLTAKDQREFREAADTLADTINANRFRTVAEVVGTKTKWERMFDGFGKFLAMHRKMASLVREFDGFKDGGQAWELLIRPMNEAGDREASMTEQATMALGAIFKPLRRRTLNKRQFIPEIGRSLSLQDRLMVALNQGNETNALRIMEGDRWTPDQVRAVLSPLTAEHWQFVQNVWDYIDSYWPQIAAKERRVSGVVPDKVEPTALTVTTSDGETLNLRGGYFPIKYDPDRSTRSEADTAAEVAQQMQRGLHARAQTRRGHTKERVSSVKRPVRKDFGVVFEHIAQVIHDLSWHEYLIDANRLLRDAEVDYAVREGWGPQVVGAIRETLTDIAVGDMGASNVLERGVNYLRTGATIAGLGWNLTTSLLQPLGLTQSMQRIGTKWVAVGIARSLRDAASLDASTTWINERSEFMRLRAKTQQREISEIRNSVSDKSGARLAFEGSFFTLIAKLQLVADVPTWIGQYEKSMAAGETEERAVALADQAVIDSQGGGQIKDLAGIQRGGPFQKLWTNFYSYFSVTYNRMAEAVNETRKVGPERLPYLAIDFLLLAVLPSVLTTLLRHGLTGNDDDDWDDLLGKMIEDQATYMLGTMFGLREIAAAFGVGNGYSGPAGARFIGETVKLGKQAQQGEIDSAALKAANNVGGILFHYPAGQISRTVQGAQAVADGEAGPQALVVGPPRTN